MSKGICGQCGGTGKLLICPTTFDGDSDRLIPDIGSEYEEPCDECEGTGFWEVDEHV
jgi:hypothetical protein